VPFKVGDVVEVYIAPGEFAGWSVITAIEGKEHHLVELYDTKPLDVWTWTEGSREVTVRRTIQNFAGWVKCPSR
jgi:hypothetical protein